MTTTVYLIRHTAYDSPRPVFPIRLPGFHLSEEGRIAANKIGEFFSRQHIAAIFCSPLERTRETAQIIAEKIHINVITDDRLLETRSPIQGKPESLSGSLGGWKIYGTTWYKKEGGEPPEEIFARMNNFMKEKVREYPGKEIIAVSHGDPIMFLVGGLQGKKLLSEDVQTLDYIQMGAFIILTFEGEHLGVTYS